MTIEPPSMCYIHRIGTAVPEQSLEPEQAAIALGGGCISRRSERLLQRVSRLTGIERRYLAALDFQNADEPSKSLYRSANEDPNGPGFSARTDAFTQASSQLVRRALSTFPSTELADVGTLVTVSCTHASSPGLERPVLADTPVPPDVHRWNLGFMGCSAVLAAIRLVAQQTANPRDALVVACELSSLHFQYTEALDQMTANLLFSDGAAALTLSSRPSPVHVVGCRCVAIPDKADEMVWWASDHGLKLRLAQELPDTLAARLPQCVDRFLRDHDTTIDAVDHWLVHPGGPLILDAVEGSLRLPTDSLALSREILRMYGNMSSPTIVFILKKLIETSATGRVVAMAFGPGLTIELALLELRNESEKSEP